MWIQQLVIYAVLGLALDAVGQDWTQPLYWCILTLVLLSNYLARKEGYQQGIDDSETTLDIVTALWDKIRDHVDTQDTNNNKDKQ